VTTDLYTHLSEPFPREMERILKKGGTSLTYIPVSEVINRMNRVLGLANWSTQVIEVHRDALDPDYIVAHVRVTANIEGQTVTRDGFGGQKINRTRAGDIVDLGDDYKGAVSDAMKKACTTLGVALYLSRSEEAMDVEASQEEPDAAEVSAEVLTLWNAFLGSVGALDAAGKTALGEFWATYAGGRPKPTEATLAQVDPADLEALLAEITRLSFGGEFADADAA
jgi:hypothetical protein